MEQQQEFRRIGGVATSLWDCAPPSGGSSTIVMVHGGDPRSLSNGLDWSSIWDPSALDARLIAYDKPGQGLSYSRSMAESFMGADAISAHLEALVESIGGPVVLMGHSRGALPAADVALRRPELVRGLVLVASNTLAPESESTPSDFYPRAYADPPEVLDTAYLRREPEMNSYSDRHVDARFVEGRRQAALRNGWWADRERRLRVYQEIAQPTLRVMRSRVLEAISTVGFAMPVLQIWGHDDRSAPVELAHSLFRLLAARTDAATSVVFNRSGHYVYREHPEWFSSTVHAFIAAGTGAR